MFPDMGEDYQPQFAVIIIQTTRIQTNPHDFFIFYPEEDKLAKQFAGTIKVLHLFALAALLTGQCYCTRCDQKCVQAPSCKGWS